jgi:dipeptidyl aminopeptidase/acylaminoacyl peptidase
MTSAARADDGKIVDSLEVKFRDEAVERLKKIRPDARTLLDTIEVRYITYLSDGLKVRGYVAMPKDSAGKKLPCLIVNRGGNRDFGAWDDDRAALMLGKMASWGYVVAASQYRGSGGSEGADEFGGRDVDDVMNLLPLLRGLSGADATRVGMHGWSRGGMMTFLALARTDQIDAAVVGGALCDAFDTIRHRADMETEVFQQIIPDYATRRDEALTARSATRWAQKLCPKTPLLVLHGSADWRADPRQSMALVQRLHELRRPVRFVLFEGGDHGISEHREEVDRLTRNWFDRYVRDAAPLPNLEPHGP